jgi:uncharacterized protein (TIGR02647 family)
MLKQISDELVAELRFLSLFNLASHQEGIKVHGNADPSMIAAAHRLFEKGMTTQNDGGYLTDFGVEVAELTQKLLTILEPR